MIKELHRSGNDTIKIHPPISPADMKHIKECLALSTDTAIGLVQKIWFDAQLQLSQKGRRGNCDLTRHSSVIKVDVNGK